MTHVAFHSFCIIGKGSEGLSYGPGSERDLRDCHTDLGAGPADLGAHECNPIQVFLRREVLRPFLFLVGGGGHKGKPEIQSVFVLSCVLFVFFGEFRDKSWLARRATCAAPELPLGSPAEREKLPVTG